MVNHHMKHQQRGNSHCNTHTPMAGLHQPIPMAAELQDLVSLLLNFL